MGWITNTLLFLGAYEGTNWILQSLDRRRLYDEALQAACDKPLLVVGDTRGRHGTGDVCIDIASREGCRIANVENLRMIPDKTFGAAFVGHVLEHVKFPAKAWAELHRVADKVFVAYPQHNSLIAWFHPEHRWIIREAGPELVFHENPVYHVLNLSKGPALSLSKGSTGQAR